MTTPTSNTQARALKLIGREVVDSYDVAKAILESAGLSGDAIPRGETWRSVKKMSDAALLAALGASAASVMEARISREEFQEISR